MLNAVKHLYRVVERTRFHTTAMYCKAQLSRLFVAISSFKYSVFLLGLLITNSSKAQTYIIKTLEGKAARIIVQDYPDKALVHLTITCSSDKLDLPVYYWTPKEVRVLGNKFLQIRYHIRAGSDISIANTLILCISHGKLHQAMHIESHSSEQQYISGQDYKHWVRQATDTKVSLDAKDTAHIISYDSLRYEQGAGHDDFTIRKYTIHFDINRHIFYNYQKRTSFTLNSYNHKINKYKTQHLFDNAFGFQINEKEYIFIGSTWYAKDRTEKEYSLVD